MSKKKGTNCSCNGDYIWNIWYNQYLVQCILSCIYDTIWRFPDMAVPLNHPFWGSPIFRNIQINKYIYVSIHIYIYPYKSIYIYVYIHIYMCPSHPYTNPIPTLPSPWRGTELAKSSLSMGTAPNSFSITANLGRASRWDGKVYGVYI
jgi:hypothetical protein